MIREPFPPLQGPYTFEFIIEMKPLCEHCVLSKSSNNHCNLLCVRSVGFLLLAYVFCMHCMFEPVCLLYICLIRLLRLCVIVWVCVVVGSIRRGPSLIESLRGWMNSWFAHSCSALFCVGPNSSD